jgi:ATP-binding cassette subfamily C protein LapB
LNESESQQLLLTLKRFSELYAAPVSLDAMTSGLPINKKIGSEAQGSDHDFTDVFARAAAKAGFTSRLVQRDLNEFSNLVLPCIVLLKGKGACILETVNKADAKAKIIHHEIDDGEIWIDVDKLAEEYLGYAYLLKRHYKSPQRALQLISRENTHWFWGTIARVKPIYVSVLVASVLINLFVLATPLYTMNVYDRVVPNDAVETLWVLAIGVIIIYAIDMVLRYLRNYMLEIAGKKSDIIMSATIFEQVMNLRMEAWPKSVGAFANTLREFESIRNFLTSASIVALVDLPFSLFFLIVIAYIAGSVVFVPLVIIIVLLTYSYFLVDPLRKSIESTYEASSNKHALLVESLYSIQTIKTMGVSHQAQWEWEEATGDIAAKSVRSKMLSGSISVTTSLLVNVSTVGIMLVGVYAVRNLDLSLGGLIATVILSSRAIAPMGQLASLIASFEQTKTSYRNLDELMTKPVERPLNKQFVTKPSFEGGISFSNVDFTYPDAGNNSLDGISINIKPGEKIGLIGKVGSGKSTLANVLTGLYATTKGTITLDGIDIQAIDPADLRRNVAYLSQDAVLFRGSLRDNIVFKNPLVKDDVLLNAAHLGGVDLFVNRYAMGFDTVLGEQGQGLSGGQRQSLAIARTLLLDTPIVVLDEPTNAMDSSTETVIKGRLHTYTRDKTLILISHKSSMLDLVDRLIVLDQGRIVMDGAKEEVLKALSS